MNSLIEKDAMTVEIVHPAPSPSEKDIPTAEEIPDAAPLP